MHTIIESAIDLNGRGDPFPWTSVQRDEPFAIGVEEAGECSWLAAGWQPGLKIRSPDGVEA